MHNMKLTTETHAPVLRAILMAMWIRRYNAEGINQYGRSGATLDATGCHHWAIIHPVSPQVWCKPGWDPL